MPSLLIFEEVYCYANQQRYREAIQAAQQAIEIAPEHAFHYYRLASVYKLTRQYAKAQQAINTSLQLNPDDTDSYSMAASIYHGQGKTDKMLAAAGSGLALDPEHRTCWNMRILALLSLGRMAEAEADIKRSLQRYPDQAFSHAAQGWSATYQGKKAQSLDAFKTALQINPNSEWAREGLIEALKAQNGLYQFILRYDLWQASFRASNPGIFWAMWLLLLLPPVRAIYLIVVLLTWLLKAFFNLLLRFDPYGRLLFAQKEKRKRG